ncbi:leucyl/phenylalanyl-tRNA--protein transferase [Hyphomicrobiales bacterium FT118]|uniref:Leucyl/phenylalanyl-tRNA--protein transferase n=2 Tax=Futiania mangrovi TaxID=2959716 RepID=A0A9J6PDB1_9PROT|nr:leucyl/phenylalanyl-tRNA--protein transferase [Futiania mangrovii]
MGQSRNDPTLYWVDPEERGILPLDGVHVPRRLARTIRQAPYTVTVDRDFGGILELCAESAPDRPETWINPRIDALYRELFVMGVAHSVECWDRGHLVGGLYGVSLGGAFFGESMVSRARDASKIALVYLVARLRYGGYRLLDTQFQTRHLAQFGVVEIPRLRYRELLAEAIDAVDADFRALPADTSPQDVLQLATQTS